MFWNKKPDPNPLGVPLGELQAMLAPTTLKTELVDRCLLVKHEHYTVRVEVVSPEERNSENGAIRAVVRVVAELPDKVAALMNGREVDSASAFNAFASLGALYEQAGNMLLGSRLTIYEQENAWSTLHLPLLLFTVIGGAEAQLGGIRQTFGQQSPKGGASKWSSRDMDQVKQYLSQLCVCTTGGNGLTAEFGLKSDSVSAAAGDSDTALYQLMSDQPHPEFGGGLFCLLQMPHRIESEDRLKVICNQLNVMEMEALDLPPHFGAWCPGRLGNNPAYVTFLPNPLYSASGIAVNVSLWALNRAQWASAMLASLGSRQLKG